MVEDASDWQSNIQRMNMVANIEEALRRAGNPPVSKSAAEMENAIFMQAKSRDEYKSRLSRLILHLQENVISRATGQFATGLPATRSMLQQQSQPPTHGIQGGGTIHVLPAPSSIGMPTTLQRPSQLGMGPMARQPAGSPANMLEASRVSPAPGMSVPSPSPGSAAPPSVQPRMGAPSPGNIMHPAPGASISSDQTNQSAATPAFQASSEEDRLYAEKLSELQVYAEPLRAMLTKLSEQPERQKDIAKLTSLFKILTSASHTSLTNLSKCEGVLKKMNILPPQSSQQRPGPGPGASALGMTAAGASASSHMAGAGVSTSAQNAGATGSSAAIATASATAAGTSTTSTNVAASVTAVTTTASAATTSAFQQAQNEQHWCQPLLNAVAESAKSPLFVEALNLTFTPVVAALRGEVIRKASVVAKLPLEDAATHVVPRAIQGELARLKRTYCVSLDTAYHSTESILPLKAVHLTCRLDDANLPRVPQLKFLLPTDYPSCNPCIDHESLETAYSSTPFFRAVKQKLLSNLTMLRGHYSMTAVLHAWSMSVRQATRSPE